MSRARAPSSCGVTFVPDDCAAANSACLISASVFAAAVAAGSSASGVRPSRARRGRDARASSTIAEAVTQSALARRESRGAHSHIDFADLDSTWGNKHNVVVKKGDAMTLVESPVVEMTEDLKQVLAEDGVTK